MSPISELSLVDAISESRHNYDAAIITTFNSYLPFYEDIVLQRLFKAGCRANTLLIDERQFTSALSNRFTRPRLAGQSYTVIPINVEKRCFHPKIILLLGKQKCALYIGSHNQTLSGFGKNRELTVHFEVDSASSTEVLDVFSSVWRGLRRWTSRHPADLLASFEFAEQTAGWALLGEALVAREFPFFFSSDRATPSLWEQVKGVLPSKAEKLTVIAPFFGESVEFLNTLRRELNPKSFVVGIQPKSVCLSPDAKQLLPDVKFVDAGELPGATGYLHAKAVVIETSDEEFLIVGSANASHSAWLSTSDGNCESVVVLRSPIAESLASDVGINLLDGLDALSPEKWQLVSQDASNLEENIDTKHRLLMAIETQDGFDIELFGVDVDFSVEAQLLDANGSQVESKKLALMGSGNANMTLEERSLRQLVFTIRLTSSSGDQLDAFVHHTSKILGTLRDDKYRELFSNLQRLDYSIDDRFWQLVEKLIFADGETLPDNLSARVTQRLRTPELATKDDDQQAQTVFSVPTINRVTRGSHSFHVSDNLGEFLAIINKHIYVQSDLPREGVEVKSEEDLIDFEEEDVPDVDDSTRTIALASLCRKRTKRMMGSMVRRLGKVERDDYHSAVAAIRQLSVVLGCLQLVRGLEASQTHLPRDVDFLDINAEWKFFLDALRLLYSTEHNTLKNVLFVSERSYSEISTTLALLVWLACDVGFEISRYKKIQERLYDDDSSEDGWEITDITNATARMLKLAGDFCSDSQAQDLSSRLFEREEMSEWYACHLDWMQRVAAASHDAAALKRANRPPRIGDLILPTRGPAKLFVVEANPGSIHVIDLNIDGGIKIFGKGYAVAVVIDGVTPK
ncbi:MAG: hypothetical protein AB7Q37_03385 [Pyrinomonadaceae bacterium]